MQKNNKIAVLGGGVWGTVIAQHLAVNGQKVRLWEFFPDLATSLQRGRRHPHVPELTLDPDIVVLSDLAASVQEADIVVIVLPSAHVGHTARRLRAALGSRKPTLINASKGFEAKTLLTMGEVLCREIPGSRPRLHTLSGPSFAREVAKGIPTLLVLAGPPGARARAAAAAFGCGPVRVSLDRDRKGTELGGSLKNAYAIGCGIIDGLRGNAAPAGDNSKAALILASLGEMASLMRALGARRETAWGPAGLGDLIATGTSHESRNRSLGEKLGRGKTLAQALSEIPTVVEGIEAARCAAALSRREGLKTPILDAIESVLDRSGAPTAVLAALGFE